MGALAATKALAVGALAATARCVTGAATKADAAVVASKKADAMRATINAPLGSMPAPDFDHIPVGI